MADLQESYRILGIPPDASLDDAKAAWRTKAQAFHPDRLHDAPPDDRAVAERQFKELSHAWRIVQEHFGATGPRYAPFGSGAADDPSNREWAETYLAQSPRGLSKKAIAVVAGVVLLVAGYFGYSKWHANEDVATYPAGLQSAFMDQCQGGKITNNLMSCHCALDALMEQVPADEFAEYDKRVATTGTLPPALYDAVVVCFKTGGR